MLRPALPSFLAALLCGCAITASPAVREAANPAALPVNQLDVAGNACGPAALLNAFRFGSKGWQRVFDAVHGKNDRERVLTVIRGAGMRPSASVPGRPRWGRRGVNVADLRDMANEMAAEQWQPQVVWETCYLKSHETPGVLLRRVHSRLRSSLGKGLPPVLSLRRHVLTEAFRWPSIDAHFITIIAVPDRLDQNARSFSVRYIDPWGGRFCEGEIRIPSQTVLTGSGGCSSCLEAIFPQSSVGAKLVRYDEVTVLTPAAVIGRW